MDTYYGHVLCIIFNPYNNRESRYHHPHFTDEETESFSNLVESQSVQWLRRAVLKSHNSGQPQAACPQSLPLPSIKPLPAAVTTGLTRLPSKNLPASPSPPGRGLAPTQQTWEIPHFPLGRAARQAVRRPWPQPMTQTLKRI